MDPLLVMTPTRTAVDPGGEARVEITIRNPGDLVEQYRFQILGEANRWAKVVPSEISVMPGKVEEMTVAVVFRPPPAPAAPAGSVPFGVRCVSLERQNNCAVIEGDIEVSAVLDLQATLVPVGAAGRRRGRYRLELANTGTLPITVVVTAVDGADLVRFALAPAEITVDARESAPVYIAVRPRTSKIIGKPVEHSIVVRYEVPGTERAGEQQTGFQQQSVIPKWLLVLVLVAALIAAAVLAWVVLRPGTDPGPRIGAGAPPSVGTLSAAAGQSGEVLLTWVPNPYATSYEVDLLGPSGTPADTNTVKAPKTAFSWTGLPSGSPCFQLVPISDSGRGPAGARACVKGLVGAVEASSAAASSAVKAAAASSSSAAASSSSVAAARESASGAAAASAAKAAAASSQASASTAASASAASAAVASASAAAASSAAASSASASSVASAAAASSAAVAASSAAGSKAAGSFTPLKWWVIYYRTPLADSSLYNQAVQTQSALQTAGVPSVQLIDSSTLSKGAPSVPFWYVIGDNFADQAAALAECKSRNGSIPNVNACTVQSPLTP